ncbi:MAG: prepilin-type N-terminal cleavage/methylation domain-containing protein [Candidatus Omnitrophica bacterium]|nr:prepilin-type N-terminal cleavage/methylation domain-containing protein [Candidatus Omnitrophota bacterium]
MLKRGFTLLEVLVVVIIIGILASIAMPQYFSTLAKARSAEGVANVGSMRMSLDRYWYENTSVAAAAADLDLLDIDNPNDVINRLYNYTVTDNGTTTTVRVYSVRAERVGDAANNWIQWTQTNNELGKLTRSELLGGPTS